MISKKKLWAAQLIFWPDSVQLPVQEIFTWCETPRKQDARYSRWMQVGLALQYPNVVFYRIEGTDYMGFRYGLHGHQYVSLYSAD